METGISYGELVALEQSFNRQCIQQHIKWTDNEACQEALFQFIIDYENSGEDKEPKLMLLGYGYEPLKFYVYAGYYELYISTEPLSLPRVYQKEFDDIRDAIAYCEEIDDTIIYCENVKDYLPNYIYEINQENNYKYYKENEN